MGCQECTGCDILKDLQYRVLCRRGTIGQVFAMNVSSASGCDGLFFETEESLNADCRRVRRAAGILSASRQKSAAAGPGAAIQDSESPGRSRLFLQHSGACWKSVPHGSAGRWQQMSYAAPHKRRMLPDGVQSLQGREMALQKYLPAWEESAMLPCYPACLFREGRSEQLAFQGGGNEEDDSGKGVA